MASDTLSELRDQAYVAANASPDDPKLGTIQVTAIINRALRNCSTKFDPWWLQTSASLSVVAGTSSYATSTLARFYKMQRIVNSDGFDLTAVGKRELSRYQRFTSAPDVYLIEEGYIKLGPVPVTDETMTVHFYQYEPGLASDTDQPTLPQPYTGWLVVEAAHIMAAVNRDWETVNFLKAERDGWIERVRDDMRQMTANPRIVLRDENQWV